MAEGPSESLRTGNVCCEQIYSLLSSIGVGTILRSQPGPMGAILRRAMAKLRLRATSIAPAVALCASLLCIACSKSPENAAKNDAAARQFNADKAVDAREREAMTRARREMEAANQKDIYKESEETFRKFASERPTMTVVEEAKAQDEVVARLRARMTDPAAVQVRNVQMNAEKTAICMEVNYQEGGRDVGFRRAFATPDATWVEPHPDEVSHRVFMLKFERMGCGSATGRK
jgi:hypothetical protein